MGGTVESASSNVGTMSPAPPLPEPVSRLVYDGAGTDVLVFSPFCGEGRLRLRRRKSNSSVGGDGVNGNNGVEKAARNLREGR